MDWDKLRIFHAVAEAGSFTHAGDTLNLSQSAVSRQISTLEESLGVSLFHRHARGLLLTEQGELLEKAAKEIFGKLSMIEGQLLDLKELQERHPHIQLTMLLDDRILNLSMREADAAIRLYKPEQQDLIQRQLTTIHFHIYGSKAYLKEHGKPESPRDLQKYCLIGYPESAPQPFADLNWLFRLAGVDLEVGFNLLMMNSMYAIHQAVENHAGLAMLPDYLAKESDNLEIVLPDHQPQPVEMYFVYPEERRHSQRIAIFRDFLLEHVGKTKF